MKGLKAIGLVTALCFCTLTLSLATPSGGLSDALDQLSSAYQQSDVDAVTTRVTPYADSPVVATEQKVLPADISSRDKFGSFTAISGDTALVGAPGEDAVYVYIRTGTGWIEQAKLVPDDGATDIWFGKAVSLSGDTALIGAFADNYLDPMTYTGSAYVFTRTGTTWTQQAKLTASDAPDTGYFGDAVLLSGDTALIGAWMSEHGPYAGSVYVFSRTGDSWSQDSKILDPTGAAFDYFGYSMALSEDTLLIGSIWDDDAGEDAGSVHVFTKTGATWTRQATLTTSDATDRDEFGWSISLSGDTAIIGAPGDSDLDSEVGSAYLFKRIGGVWTEQTKLTAGDARSFNRFGMSVSLSGNLALVGASGPRYITPGTPGQAYLFSETGGEWTEQLKLTSSDGASGDYFGFAVTVSGDTALIGARGHSANGTESGAAYFYSLALSDVPIPDITANGVEGPLVLEGGDPLRIDISLLPVPRLGQNADWWVSADSPVGPYWYTSTGQWVRSDTPILGYSGPLVNLPPYTVYDSSGLPEGDYLFSFAVDDNQDNIFDAHHLDQVQVSIRGLVHKTPLNDTGITSCSDDTAHGLPCPVVGFAYQDAEHGRDATRYNDADGHAGFSFTKIDADGNPLSADAQEWSCVKDNVTGLMWEVKTTDGDLHDRNHTYSWYNPDMTENGGDAGLRNGGFCVRSMCDTSGYVEAVNLQGLCGAADWRMPTSTELENILSIDRADPAIDTAYFPNTVLGNYWSSSPYSSSSVRAWYVGFTTGYIGTLKSKSSNYSVRLVRED